MAVVYETLDRGLVRTYSNAGFKVHGGLPEGDYDVAYDPADAHREYTETDIPVDAPPAPEKGHRSLSRVNLYHALDDLGIWEQVKAYMEQAGIWNDFDYATTLDEDSDLVKNAVSALKASLGLTDEQIEAVMDQAAIS